MKKSRLIIIWGILNCVSATCDSQTNLIPNGGFETYSLCPTDISDLSHDEVSNAIGWYSTLNTPDYFNSCATYSMYPDCSVPSNFFGYQYPASGNAYAGFWCYGTTSGAYREIMGAQLITPLVIGQKYYVKYKLNLTLSYNSNCASSNIGIRFNSIQHNLSNPSIINNFSNIYSGSIITDSLGWTTMFESFTPDSSYSYIEIGNFFDDSNTNIQIMRSQSGSNFSYYFVDDVCISTDSIYSLNWSDTSQTTPLSSISVKSELAVYPNPSTGRIHIKNLPSSEQVKMKIYDLYGAEVESVKINFTDNVIEFDVPGVFYVSLATKEYNLFKKVIINKP